MVISKLVIVSRDVVKPCSPTPSNRKIYNLSPIDQLSTETYIPIVAIFRSSATDPRSFESKTTELKNSLSQTLTKYYPFAGRMCQSYVDCNDTGVDFIEARNGCTLSDFLDHADHRDLDQLWPDGLIWSRPNNVTTSPIISVQINHFACGGLAVAVSLIHKIGDGCSVFTFINDWATVTRSKNKDASEINPYFVTNFQPINVKVPEFFLDTEEDDDDYVTRSFVFPNSKKNDLKAMTMKMAAMEEEFGGQPIITNPTFAECLIWMIHKCAVGAATEMNSGTFEPTGVHSVINMRSNFMDEPLPDTTIGNLCQRIVLATSNESEITTPNAIIGEIQKRKTEVRRIKDIESMMGMIEETDSEAGMIEKVKKMNAYYYSFMNRFPAYAIDFGWGTPVRVTVAGTRQVSFFMPTPNEEGIEALVSLDRRQMEIFQNDPTLLAFC